MHWYHGKCPYPEIGSESKDMLVGLLMGDGSIPTREANSVFHLPMINRRFLRWFDDQMEVLTTGVSLKKTATELASNNRETGFSSNAKQEDYHDIYTVWSRTHPLFNQLREWYESGQKRFPADLELTPTVTKFWYLCDGYLDVGQWGRPRLEIKARNERSRADYLSTCSRTSASHRPTGDTNSGSPVTRRSDWWSGSATRRRDSSTSGRQSRSTATTN